MSRKSCLALFVVLAAVLTACGSDEKAPTSDKHGAQAVVLEVSDLPDGSSEAKEALVSEECDPITYFQSYASAVAAPLGFILPESELLQRVGVFKNSRQARKAFDEVTSKSARSCVGVQMQNSLFRAIGSRGTLRSEAIQKSLPGETMRTMRLVATAPLANVEVQRTAILQERLLTTLTFISLNQPVSPNLWKSVSRHAADRVDEAVSSIAN